MYSYSDEHAAKIMLDERSACHGLGARRPDVDGTAGRPAGPGLISCVTTSAANCVHFRLFPARPQAHLIATAVGSHRMRHALQFCGSCVASDGAAVVNLYRNTMLDAFSVNTLTKMPCSTQHTDNSTFFCKIYSRLLPMASALFVTKADTCPLVNIALL